MVLSDLKLLFRVWLGIGLQSFGGGTTTTLLIRRSAVDIHQWTTDEQFNRDWALCQVTPGINLIAMTILLGKQIAGWRGIVICLAGLLLPSVMLTAIITAGFLAIRDLPTVKGALRGILPATVGLGLVTACQMAYPPLRTSWNRGTWQILFAIIVLISSAGVLWSGTVSVTVVLLSAGVIGAVESVLFERIFGKPKDSGI